jgi:WXG100 family type VII secretion target
VAAERMQVNPQHLVTSAGRVDGHAQHMRGAHASADLRLESALPGWPRAAGAAMAAKSANWQRTTRALVARMAEQARQFDTAAGDYQGTEEHSAAGLRD